CPPRLESMDTSSTPLPPLPEDGIRRVLCVVAHPDDMEYGTSAAVAAWTGAGIEVSYLLLTRGEAGMAEAPEVVGPLREQEQRRDIARVVRQVRPDLVLTANFEVEAYGGLNQADHRIAGLAAVDGTRDAANPWVFRELAEQEQLAPWRARGLLVAGHPRPTHAKHVGADEVQAAVESLQAHEAYLAHVEGHPLPEEFIPEMLRA